MHRRQEGPWNGQDRRGAERLESVTGVRLIILGPDYIPIAERSCSSVNLSSIGLAVATPGVLEPGTNVVVSMPAGEGTEVWLGCVAHSRIKPDGSRVVGIERREMPAGLAAAPWLDRKSVV